MASVSKVCVPAVLIAGRPSRSICMPIGGGGGNIMPLLLELPLVVAEDVDALPVELELAFEDDEEVAPPLPPVPLSPQAVARPRNAPTAPMPKRRVRFFIF